MTLTLNWLSKRLVLLDDEFDPDYQNAPLSKTELSEVADSNAAPQRMNKDSETIVLAVQSHQIFVSSHENLPKRILSHEDQLAYEIETNLPLQAEDMAIDCLTYDENCLVFVTDARHLLHAHATLTEAGFVPVAMVPLCCLALAWLRSELKLEQTGLVAVCLNGEVDLFEIMEGRMTRWHWIGRNYDLLLDVCDAWERNQSSNLAIFGANNDDLEPLRDRFDRSDTSGSVTFTECELQTGIIDIANCIAFGKQRPLVDFFSSKHFAAYHNAAIRLPQRIASWSIVLFLCACALAFGLLSARYRTATEQFVAQQDEVFKDLFPGERTPVGITARLRSELRELKGTRGSSVPVVLSVSPVLQSFLNAMPTDIRLRIDRVNLEATELVLVDGAVVSFADLDKVTGALASNGFDVRPASANQTKNGITLRLERFSYSRHKNLLSSEKERPRVP